MCVLNDLCKFSSFYLETNGIVVNIAKFIAAKLERDMTISLKLIF